MGKSDLKRSNRELQSFRKRHQIVFNKVYGECNNVTEETIGWLPKCLQLWTDINQGISQMVKKLSYFLLCIPKKTLCLKCEKKKIQRKTLQIRFDSFRYTFMTGDMENIWLQESR
jgi:hypothetical protein